MRPVYALSLSIMLFVLPRPSSAGTIEILNHIDNKSVFSTVVRGSVGFFSSTHTLVDIPNTPWVNSSVIVETNASAGQGDSLSITWTSNHVVGPDIGTDVDPNPNGPVTLSLSFTATAAGKFAHMGGVEPTDPLQASRTIQHPADGGPHFDVFRLGLDVEVGGTLLGGFDIESYTIGYAATHCLLPFTLPGLFICDTPFPPPPVPGDPPLLVFGLDCEPADEFCSSRVVSTPGTLTLLLAGAASLAATLRKRRRGREHDSLEREP